MGNSPDKLDAFVSLSVISFVDREIEKERLLTTSERERLRELLMEKFVSLEKAENLARMELARRLELLNNEHAHMADDRSLFLRKESHEVFYAEYSKWKIEVNDKLANTQGKAQMTIILVGFALTFAGLITTLAMLFSRLSQGIHQ